MTTKMRSEIAEQPQALRATLDALLPRIGEVGRCGRQTRQLLFIARGTSDNAAVYGRYLVEPTPGGCPPSPRRPSRPPTNASSTWTACWPSRISQSGRTEEIVETLAWAQDCGARTVGITNGGADSPLAQVADLALCTRRGRGEGRPGHQDLHHPARRAGRPRRWAWAPTSTRRPAPRAGRGREAGHRAGRPGGGRRGPGGQARRGGLGPRPGLLHRAGVALKLKEACYLHAMGLSYADLLHGPIAVVDADTPALLVAAGEQPDAARHGRAGRAGHRAGASAVHHRRRPRSAPGSPPRR